MTVAPLERDLLTLVPISDHAGSYTAYIDAIAIPDIGTDPEQVADAVSAYGHEDYHETDSGEYFHIYTLETWERFYVTVDSSSNSYLEVHVEFPDRENFIVVNRLDDDIRDSQTEVSECHNTISFGLQSGERGSRYMQILRPEEYANAGAHYVSFIE